MLGVSADIHYATGAYPEHPYIDLDMMIISMESSGLLVYQISEVSDLHYKYVSNNIAYTSCCLLAACADQIGIGKILLIGMFTPS